MTADRFKFRAWTWDTRYPDYEKKDYMLDVLWLNSANGYMGVPYKIDKERIALIDKAVLMQSTGLTDKNGVEIFEGDVVQQNRYGKCSTWAVEWDHHCAGFGPFFYSVSDQGAAHSMEEKAGEFRCDYYSPAHSEVIGNIYEHPELMEPKP